MAPKRKMSFKHALGKLTGAMHFIRESVPQEEAQVSKHIIDACRNLWTRTREEINSGTAGGGSDTGSVGQASSYSSEAINAAAQSLCMGNLGRLKRPQEWSGFLDSVVAMRQRVEPVILALLDVGRDTATAGDGERVPLGDGMEVLDVGGGSYVDEASRTLIHIWADASACGRFTKGWGRIWNALLRTAASQAILAPVSLVLELQATKVTITSLVPLLPIPPVVVGGIAGGQQLTRNASQVTLKSPPPAVGDESASESNEPSTGKPPSGASPTALKLVAEHLSCALCTSPGTPWEFHCGPNGMLYIMSIKSATRHRLTPVAGGTTVLRDNVMLWAIAERNVRVTNEPINLPNYVVGTLMATFVKFYHGKLKALGAKGMTPEVIAVNHSITEAMHRFGINTVLLPGITAKFQELEPGELTNAIVAASRAEAVMRVLKMLIRADVSSQKTTKDRCDAINRVLHLFTTGNDEFFIEHVAPSYRRKFGVPLDVSSDDIAPLRKAVVKLMVVTLHCDFDVKDVRVNGFLPSGTAHHTVLGPNPQALGDWPEPEELAASGAITEKKSSLLLTDALAAFVKLLPPNSARQRAFSVLLATAATMSPDPIANGLNVFSEAVEARSKQVSPEARWEHFVMQTMQTYSLPVLPKMKDSQWAAYKATWHTLFEQQMKPIVRPAEHEDHTNAASLLIQAAAVRDLKGLLLPEVATHLFACYIHMWGGRAPFWEFATTETSLPVQLIEFSLFVEPNSGPVGDALARIQTAVAKDRGNNLGIRGIEAVMFAVTRIGMRDSGPETAIASEAWEKIAAICQECYEMLRPRAGRTEGLGGVLWPLTGLLTTIARLRALGSSANDEIIRGFRGRVLVVARATLGKTWKLETTRTLFQIGAKTLIAAVDSNESAPTRGRALLFADMLRADVKPPTPPPTAPEEPTDGQQPEEPATGEDGQPMITSPVSDNGTGVLPSPSGARQPPARKKRGPAPGSIEALLAEGNATMRPARGGEDMSSVPVDEQSPNAITTRRKSFHQPRMDSDAMSRRQELARKALNAQSEEERRRRDIAIAGFREDAAERLRREREDTHRRSMDEHRHFVMFGTGSMQNSQQSSVALAAALRRQERNTADQRAAETSKTNDQRSNKASNNSASNPYADPEDDVPYRAPDQERLQEVRQYWKTEAAYQDFVRKCDAIEERHEATVLALREDERRARDDLAEEFRIGCVGRRSAPAHLPSTLTPIVDPAAGGESGKFGKDQRGYLTPPPDEDDDE